MTTFTRSPEEGAVVTTELGVSNSSAQEEASSIESAEVQYLLHLCETLLNLNYYSNDNKIINIMCYVSVIQIVKAVPPPVVSEDESRQKTELMLDENNRTNPEEVCEDSTVKHPGCESEETSFEPTPEEPMFILSLTEIPPTLDEGAGLWTELLPPAAVSESHSHGQRYLCFKLLSDAINTWRELNKHYEDGMREFFPG